jgi:hypothetical protein
MKVLLFLLNSIAGLDGIRFCGARNGADLEEELAEAAMLDDEELKE